MLSDLKSPTIGPVLEERISIIDITEMPKTVLEVHQALKKKSVKDK
jgi:exonuclease V gamma subunit